MTENNFYDLGVCNRYIGMLSQNRKAMKEMLEQLRALKKLSKEQKVTFDKAKKDLNATEACLKLWEDKEASIIGDSYGTEYLLPKY